VTHKPHLPHLRKVGQKDAYKILIAVSQLITPLARPNVDGRTVLKLNNLLRYQLQWLFMTNNTLNK
jgi:hypothetical protein